MTLDPRHRPARAITALELLVVMLVVSVLTMAGISLFGPHLRRSATEHEARKVNRLFNVARSSAVAQNAYYQATFWLEGQAYWIDEVDAAGQVTKPKVVPLERLDDSVRITDLEIDSTLYTAELNDVVTVRFNPDGSSQAAAVHLLRRGDDTTDDSLYYTVKLYGPTARSLIFERERR